MVGIDYTCFEHLIHLFRGEGHVEQADKLHTLLHETGWTTGSELLGELGLSILQFQRSLPSVNAELTKCIETCVAMVRKQWPDIR
jgi:hypothetical protein